MENIDSLLHSSFITLFLCSSVQEQNVLEQESGEERKKQIIGHIISFPRFCARVATGF